MSIFLSIIIIYYRLLIDLIEINVMNMSCTKLYTLRKITWVLIYLPYGIHNIHGVMGFSFYIRKNKITTHIA